MIHIITDKDMNFAKVYFHIYSYSEWIILNEILFFQLFATHTTHIHITINTF